MNRSGSHTGRNLIALIGIVLLLLLAPTSRAQQTAAAPERPSGMITGRVMNSGGEPLAGAVVFVSAVGGSASHSASVDSTGNFKVDALENGIYRVSASVPGFVTMPLPAGADPIYYHPGDSVTLTLIKGAVISGTVTGPGGPAIATSVRALRVRDDEGKALASPTPMRDRMTDDRGAFRLYGLPPGAYLVSAGGPSRFGFAAIGPSAYDTDTPTYSPSGTRDTASEIIVRSGEEATADIQYRGEPGHAISGTIAGVIQSGNQVAASSVNLNDIRGQLSIMSALASSTSNFSFSFVGVPDGEYDLAASQFLPSRDFFRSSPRRVTVHGADVTGLTLTLAPLASIEGRLVLENDPKAACAKRRDSASQETIIFARRYESETKPAANTASKTPPATADAPLLLSASEAVPDAKRTFSMKNLESGAYRLESRPPASGWYVRSIAIGPTQTAAGRNAALAVARDGINLRSGEHLSGLSVTITEGGAGLQGRITLAEGQHLPSRTRVYVVPAERENAEDVLRFFETFADASGKFAIDNMAPGRYLIVARADDSDPARPKRIRQDVTLRATVVHEADISKKEISVKPCEQAADYELPWVSNPRP